MHTASLRGWALLVLLVGMFSSGAAGASPPAAPADPHGAAEAAPGDGEHGAEHHFNWYHGVLGEQGSGLCGLIGQQAGQAPTVLCREPGSPVPFGALLFNTGLLFWLFWAAGRGPIRDWLRRRRSSIQRAVDEAGRMREEAAARLAEYQDRLQHIDDEIDRVRREMRAAGEAEQARILAEARDKRDRLQRDVQLVLDQEMKAAREQLRSEVIRSASESARELLLRQVSSADHVRLGDEYLRALGEAATPPGGRA